jgi:hypothetical protein
VVLRTDQIFISGAFPERFPNTTKEEALEPWHLPSDVPHDIDRASLHIQSEASQRRHFRKMSEGEIVDNIQSKVPVKPEETAQLRNRV